MPSKKRPAKEVDVVDTSPFITLIKRHMRVNNLGQTEMAERIGIEQSALSRLLRNKHRRPEPETIVAVALEIGRPVWDVALAGGYPFSSPTVPSADDERLLRLVQADPAIRSILEQYFGETREEVRESLLRLMAAMLDRADRQKGSGPGSE